MATEDCFLLKLPLELRNAIYEFASARPTAADLVLKEYLEKIDHTIPRLTAPQAAPSGAPVPTVQDQDDDDDDDEDEESNDGEDASDSIDADATPPSAQDGDSAIDAEVTTSDMEQTQYGEDEVMTDGAEIAVTGGEFQGDSEAEAAATDNEGVVDGSSDHQDGAQEIGEESGNEDSEGDAEVDDQEEIGNGEDEHGVDEDGEEEDEDDDGGEDGGEDEEEEEDEDEDGDGQDQVPAAPARRARNQGRNTKYRHMLPILQLSHPPPPVELLQLCKQIKGEAIQQNRSKCVLKVNVTKGFEHFSFFNETLTTLIDASFSPLEHVRKVTVVIAWDSEWLREKTAPPDREIEDAWFFKFYLDERMQVIVSLINACPELEKVAIEYHDTEDTPTTRTDMVERLAPLHNAIDNKFFMGADDFPTSVEVETKEFFTAAGTAHARDSVLALQRAEFDRFLLNGLQMR